MVKDEDGVGLHVVAFGTGVEWQDAVWKWYIPRMKKIEEFALAFTEFVDSMREAAVPLKRKDVFPEMIRRHLGADPVSLVVISESFGIHDWPNVQLALDNRLAQPGQKAEITGFSVEEGFRTPKLQDLLSPSKYGSPKPAPVTHIPFPIPGGKAINCKKNILALIESDGRKLVAVLTAQKGEVNSGVSLEVMGARFEDAEAFMQELRIVMRRENVYRGRVISLTMSDYGERLTIKFHELPTITREDIILPERTLRQLEMHTVEFTRHAAALREAGRHLKRGLLLHGPPGTGKTLSAMYLAARMEGRTVLLVTGSDQGLIEYTCRMARMMEPATVILEDVDLIGSERDYGGGCNTPLLFELLNQMDGLASDCDVLFLLTTNRADALEPALAARPGRVDQIIEIGLPDLDGRLRLMQRYAKGLDFQVKDLRGVARKTEGASAAFMKELLRRAALIALCGGRGTRVTDADIRHAMEELAISGGRLSRRTLGFYQEGDAPEDEEDEE